jgi:hypothetical protein
MAQIGNNEIIPTIGMDYTVTSTNFNTFKNYFHIMKECPINSGISNCWADGEIFSGHPWSTSPGFIDSSGMAWSIGRGTYNYW